MLLANQELKALQDELERTRKAMRRRSTVRMSFTAVEEAAFSKEQVGGAVCGWAGQCASGQCSVCVLSDG